MSVDPRFTPGYTMLAQLYMQQRRIDEARAEFEGMVKRDPSAVGARTMVGMLFEAQGRRDDARKSYEATVNGTGNAPVAANNLAFIYAEQGTNLDVALQLATSAKQRLPDDPSVDDTIGWIYYKKDLPSLAVGPLEDSLRKRPDAAEVLYHLGLTYAKLGDKAKAREALERALKLDPTVGGDEARRCWRRFPSKVRASEIFTNRLISRPPTIMSSVYLIDINGLRQLFLSRQDGAISALSLVVTKTRVVLTISWSLGLCSPAFADQIILFARSLLVGRCGANPR